MISIVEAMTHFSGNFNRSPKLGTAQGSVPTSSELPPSFTLPIVPHSFATVVGILPVTERLPASFADQDRGASEDLLLFPRGRSVLLKLLLTRGNR